MNAPANDVSERDEEKRAIELLAYRGVYMEKNVVQPGRFAFAMTGLGEGSSDLVGVDSKQNGRAVYIEMKKKGEKPTDKQLEYILRKRSQGAVAVIAWSAGEALELVMKARAEARKKP